MENKIEAIVFDYGGVIELSNGISSLKVASDSIGIPISEVENIYYKYNHFSNAKNMNWYNMFDMVLSERCFMTVGFTWKYSSAMCQCMAGGSRMLNPSSSP